MESIIDKKLFNYIQILNEAEKKSVLLMLKTFLKNRSTKEDYYTIEDYNNEIDEALLEFENGNFISQTELESISKKW